MRTTNDQPLSPVDPYNTFLWANSLSPGIRSSPCMSVHQLQRAMSAVLRESVSLETVIKTLRGDRFIVDEEGVFRVKFEKRRWQRNPAQFVDDALAFAAMRQEPNSKMYRAETDPYRARTGHCTNDLLLGE